jgi:hypothetical protein
MIERERQLGPRELAAALTASVLLCAAGIETHFAPHL